MVAEVAVTDEDHRNDLDLHLRWFDTLSLPKSSQQELVKNLFYFRSNSSSFTTMKTLLNMCFRHPVYPRRSRNRNSLMKRITTAVLTAHYSSIVWNYMCASMYPRSAMIDVPSEASGLWGWQIWPLQRWVDQQLCSDWLPTWRNSFDASRDLVEKNTWDTLHAELNCSCVWQLHTSTQTLPKHLVGIPYLPTRVMDW